MDSNSQILDDLQVIVNSLVGRVTQLEHQQQDQVMMMQQGGGEGRPGGDPLASVRLHMQAEEAYWLQRAEHSEARLREAERRFEAGRDFQPISTVVATAAGGGRNNASPVADTKLEQQVKIEQQEDHNKPQLGGAPAGVHPTLMSSGTATQDGAEVIVHSQSTRGPSSGCPTQG